MKRINEPCGSIEMQSPLSDLTLIASNRGIKAIFFDNETSGRTEVFPFVKSGINSRLLKEAKKQLSEYFDGKRKDFDLSLAPEGTAFQTKVWNLLRTIPYGKTVSYSALAAVVGDKNKARAVGAANGKNPIPIIIPCHRVIGMDGSLTGYAGGVAKKSFLLQLELTRA